MQTTNGTPTLLLLITAAAVILVLITVIAVLLIARSSKGKKSQPRPTQPLPGGGGSYVMHISGMNCEHCKANAEAALNAFEGVTAQVDLKTETAYIKYSGYPDLTLLDRLREAVEEAGFTVTEIR